MGKKKSFLIYYDWEDSLRLLSNEQKGDLFWGLFLYAKYGEPPIFKDDRLLFGFNLLKGHIDRDFEKYEKICEARSNSGKLGAMKKSANAKLNKQMLTNASDTKQMLANEADKEKDNEKDKEKDKDKNKDNIDIPPLSSKAVCEYSEDFLEFWKEYPKKVGKGEAFKKWKKERISGAELSDILNALKWQKSTDVWRKNGGQYIPNPSTYISQRRWEDEPLTISTDITDPTRYNDGDQLPDFILRGDF